MNRRYRRDDEQRILDGIALGCVFLDIFVGTTFLSLLYFPEYVNLLQNASVYFMILFYLTKQLTGFILRLSAHRNFVNSQSMFAVRASDIPNPAAIYICKLEWANPESFLDFRTITVPLSLYEPPLPTPPSQPSQFSQPSPPTHPYNTRSKRRA